MVLSAFPTIPARNGLGPHMSAFQPIGTQRYLELVDLHRKFWIWETIPAMIGSAEHAVEFNSSRARSVVLRAKHFYHNRRMKYSTYLRYVCLHRSSLCT